MSYVVDLFALPFYLATKLLYNARGISLPMSCCIAEFGVKQSRYSSGGRGLCLESRVSWVRVPPRGIVIFPWKNGGVDMPPPLKGTVAQR